MKVIIIKPTKKIKKIGEIVQVKKGYARNYLLPNNFAIRATEENKNKFEALRKDLDVKYQSEHKEALKLIEKIKDATLTFISQSLDDGKLFGSITARQIVNQLNSDFKVSVRHDQVHISEPIKNIGVFSVEIELHHEAITNILVNVARSESEAVNQLNNFKSAQAKEANQAQETKEEAVKEEVAIQE
jgi:large subunit ribosomal protein L9